jgi:O-antigen/teichoic acid export membrane protein
MGSNVNRRAEAVALTEMPHVDHHATQASAVRGSLWTLVTASVTLPFSLVVTAVTVRVLDTSEFAQFSLYVAIFLYAMPLFNAGISESAMQWIAEAHARGRVSDVVAIVRRVAGYHLLVQGPLTIALTVILLNDAPTAAVVVLVASNVAYVMFESSYVVLISTGRNAEVARFVLVTNVVTAPAVITVAALTGSGAATWAAQAACLAIGPALAFTSLSRELKRAVLTPRLPRAWPVGYLGYAVSALVAGYVGMLVFGRSEIFLLSVLGTSSAVAAFSVIGSLASKLTVLVDSLMGPIAPVAAGLVATTPHLAPQALGRALRISTVLAGGTMAIALPAAIVLMPPLFGEQFRAVQPALLALGLVSCLLTAAGPLNAFAFATRSVRRVLIVNLICLALDAGIALALIRPLGLWGAVAASCVSQVVATVLMFVLIARRLQIDVRRLLAHSKSLLVAVPTCLLASVAAILVQPAVPALVISLTIGVVLLLAALALYPGARLEGEDVDMVVRGFPEPWSTRVRNVASRIKLVRLPT